VLRLHKATPKPTTTPAQTLHSKEKHNQARAYLRHNLRKLTLSFLPVHSGLESSEVLYTQTKEEKKNTSGLCGSMVIMYYAHWHIVNMS
jgi:hypothetical protein